MKPIAGKKARSNSLRKGGAHLDVWQQLREEVCDEFLTDQARGTVVLLLGELGTYQADVRVPHGGEIPEEGDGRLGLTYSPSRPPSNLRPART